MFTVMCIDPYEDMGQKWETFKNESAASVYGRSNYGEGNYIVVPTDITNKEGMEDGFYSNKAA